MKKTLTNFSRTIVSAAFSIYACNSLDRAGIFPLRSQNDGVSIDWNNAWYAIGIDVDPDAWDSNKNPIICNTYGTNSK